MKLSLTKRRVITALAVWFVTRAVLYLIARSEEHTSELQSP